MSFRYVDKFIFASMFLAITLSAQAQITPYEGNLIKDYAGQGYLSNGMIQTGIDAGVEGLIGPFYNDGFESGDEGAYYQVRWVNQLNAALAKLPAKTGLVYRGVSLSSGENIEMRYFPGRVWLEPRYSSATTDLKVATEFAKGAYKNEGCGGCSSSVKTPYSRRVLLTYRSLSGRLLGPYGNATEKEVLFPARTYFKVLSAGRAKDGSFRATIQEVDPNKLRSSDKAALRKSEAERLRFAVEKRFCHYDTKTYEDCYNQFKAQVTAYNLVYNKWLEEGVLDLPINLDQGGR